MSELTIKGKIIANLGLQKGMSKAGKEWVKASLIILTGDQYPKKIVLDNMKNAESFASLPTETEGTFYVDIESREYNGRWYTGVSCYKWELAQSAFKAPEAPKQAAPQAEDTFPF